MRRVVITGLGLISPLGAGVKPSWQKLIAGKSGVGRISLFHSDDMPVSIAAEVPGPDKPDGFNPESVISPKDIRKMDRFIQLAIGAAEEALADAGWKPTEQEDLERTGVMIGSGIGGLPCIETNSRLLAESGSRKISPFFIPSCLINLPSGHISIRYGFQGPNHSVVTACATGAHAIGDAARLIQYDDADVMIAGGAESAICGIGMAGFAAARALSTNFQDTPERASRPWDKDRDGFVMGEGSGIMVLEEYEHAKARGAHIYAELTGYGLSGDAYHITAPHPEGRGARRAMEGALRHARMNPESIGYINAHGTSTPPGDAVEVRAVKAAFKDHAYQLAMSSTKSAIGHLLGGAGSAEAVISVMALTTGIMPPTLNLDTPSEDCDLNFIPHKAQEKKLQHVMSNAFGFGGTNASLIMSKL